MDLPRSQFKSFCVFFAVLLLSITTVTQAQIASTLNLPSNDSDGRFTITWPAEGLGFESEATWNLYYYEEEYNCQPQGDEDEDCDTFFEFPNWLTVENTYVLQEARGSSWIDLHTVSQSRDSSSQSSENGEDLGADQRASSFSYDFERPNDGAYRFRLVKTKTFYSSEDCNNVLHCLPKGTHIVSTQTEDPKLIRVNTGIKEINTSGPDYKNITSNLTMPIESESGYFAIGYVPQNTIGDLIIEDEITTLEYRQGTTGGFQEVVTNLSSSGYIVRDQQPGVYQYRVKHEIIYYDNQNFDNYVKAGYPVAREEFVSTERLTVYEQTKQIEVSAKEDTETVVLIQNGGISVPIIINIEPVFPLEVLSFVNDAIDSYGNALLSWTFEVNQGSYELQWYSDDDGQWNTIYRGNQANYLASNLGEREQQFRVKACAEGECSEFIDFAIASGEIKESLCAPFIIDEAFK